MDIYLTEARRTDDHRALHLTWSDGHQAELTADYLRGYCPCASCQGHGVEAIEYHPPAQSVTADRVEPVGNYAISIVFSDRHATGIYRFDFLRQICPCEACIGSSTT